MEVFLSWSGARSREVAETLRDWLPQVIQALQPWISPDIGKGERWGGEIASRLESARVGILCLTSENLREPWLLFEAGAISKQKDSRTCTFLLDVKPADVDQPLGQFQHTVCEKDDVLKLLTNLNSDLEKSGGKPLKPDLLASSFNKSWPELEHVLRKIRERKAAAKEDAGRSETEKLDEALDLLRGISRKLTEPQTPNLAQLFTTGLLSPPPESGKEHEGIIASRKRPAAFGLGSMHRDPATGQLYFKSIQPSAADPNDDEKK